MLPHRDSKLTRIALIIFFIVILLYGIYEAQGLLFGPKIKMATAREVVHDPYIKIEGQADRIASLSMNGKDVPVTEQGDFSEPFLLAEGDNQVTLEAKDTYGRVTKSSVEIVYVPQKAPAAAASTTTSSSTQD
jgi:hypothetical protein